MIEGKTNTGFAFSLNEEVLDDYELVEALCDVDDGNFGSIVKVVDMLLGGEQKKALKEHIRSLNGKVSVTMMCDEVTQIFNACNDLKNS